MKKIILLFVAASTMVCCHNKDSSDKSAKNSRCFNSFEVKASDTINRIDCDGKRQGKWIRNKTSSTTDTIWQHGDTLYFKDGILTK